MQNTRENRSNELNFSLFEKNIPTFTNGHMHSTRPDAHYARTPKPETKERYQQEALNSETFDTVLQNILLLKKDERMKILLRIHNIVKKQEACRNP